MPPTEAQRRLCCWRRLRVSVCMNAEVSRKSVASVTGIGVSSGAAEILSRAFLQCGVSTRRNSALSVSTRYGQEGFPDRRVVDVAAVVLGHSDDSVIGRILPEHGHALLQQRIQFVIPPIGHWLGVRQPHPSSHIARGAPESTTTCVVRPWVGAGKDARRPARRWCTARRDVPCGRTRSPAPELLRTWCKNAASAHPAYSAHRRPENAFAIARPRRPVVDGSRP